MSVDRLPDWRSFDKHWTVFVSCRAPVRVPILSSFDHTILARQSSFASLTETFFPYQFAPRPPGFINDDRVPSLPLKGVFTFGRKGVHFREKNTPSVSQFQADNHSKTAYSIEHANRLIKQHGEDFASYFVSYACQIVRDKGFGPNYFGRLMHLEDAATLEFRQQQARQAKALAEQAEAREIELRRVYERDCQDKLGAYQASLKLEALANLKEQLCTELRAREDIFPVARGLERRLKLDQRLSTLAGATSFEAWQDRQKEI